MCFHFQKKQELEKRVDKKQMERKSQVNMDSREGILLQH